MDKRIDIWNILHDGEITALSEISNDTLTMFVSIPYLRRRLKPLGDSFILTLRGNVKVDFIDYEGKHTNIYEELEIGTPEILSTESEEMPVNIGTTMGKIVLDFDSINYSMDTGQPIEYNDILKVCKEYWDEWSSRSKA